MRRDDAARRLWFEVYGALSEGRPGLLGAMTGRAEAQVMRLALVYALLDKSPSIREVHLRAALAVWDYCERSARHIFGEKLGDPMADEILRLVRASEDGVRRTVLRDNFSRHAGKGQLENALAMLRELALVDVRTETTGGRPGEVWFATSPGGDKSDISDQSLTLQPAKEVVEGTSVALVAYVAPVDCGETEPQNGPADDGAAPTDGDESREREVF